jgi:hypothetical protein
MIENLMELIAKLQFGTTIERAEDCALMEQTLEAEICGKYNRFLPANTLHITTETEDYLVMLRDDNLLRMDLMKPEIMLSQYRGER